VRVEGTNRHGSRHCDTALRRGKGRRGDGSGGWWWWWWWWWWPEPVVASPGFILSFSPRVSRLPGATPVSSVGAHQVRRRQPSSPYFGRGRSIPHLTAPTLFPPLSFTSAIVTPRALPRRGPAAADRCEAPETTLFVLFLGGADLMRAYDALAARRLSSAGETE